MAGPSFRELFGHRLWVLAHAVEERTEAAIRAVCGLSMREARILATISSAGDAKLDHIRDAAGLERAYASRLIAGLVTRGLLEKRADPQDGRTASWRLTEQGRQVHATMHRESVQRNRAWLDVLPPDQQASFNACVETLTAHVRSMPAVAAPDAAGDDGRADPRPGTLDDAGGRGGARDRAGRGGRR